MSTPTPRWSTSYLAALAVAGVLVRSAGTDPAPPEAPAGAAATPRPGSVPGSTDPGPTALLQRTRYDALAESFGGTKAEIPADVYEAQVSMMEMVLDVDDIAKEMSAIREQYCQYL